MTSFNELVIGSSQGSAFLLKIVTEVFQYNMHFKGHGLAMISHKCEPSVSKEFNLFSVVDFYCLCVCHSNSPTVCSALKNGHLLCRIEHFHFLDGILTSLCIFYSILYTVLSLSWTVWWVNIRKNSRSILTKNDQWIWDSEKIVKNLVWPQSTTQIPRSIMSTKKQRIIGVVGIET